MRYFGWAKAPTVHCCSKGWWHHPNPSCSVLLLGCIWAFLNRLFCAPSSKLCRGGIWGPCLSVGFLPGVPDSLYNHIGTHLHGPSARQSGCAAFGATRFPDGKVSARNRTAFPEALRSQGQLIDTDSISPCVLGGSLWKFRPFFLSFHSFLLSHQCWVCGIPAKLGPAKLTPCVSSPALISVGPGQPLPTHPPWPCRQ